jgi:hypothetical protein
VMADCRDFRCTDGLTMCRGCNGYGVLRPTGKKYLMRSGGKNITDYAIPHTVCGGTGLAVCGCVPVVSAAGVSA